ncbi:nicotinate-nucleotide--dimethylbenzimidazole phosphoribosyltransferase [Nonomuraea longicatena]|uniref:Nicotinate-nucleotide--dimethylbenzimidazole phosphoribosyltransferase n=1 Tax=Nonomuraea longicatena TaxID=83682 RepID=A0ABP3Z7K2_9ACTN
MLDETLAAIRPADAGVLAAARAYQDRLTKPPGSLGVLEDVAVRLAGAAGVTPPPIPEPAALAIFAADHGVHAQGVSQWPQEVTAQMVANFLAGGAVANVFANQIGASVTVVDVGVKTDLPSDPTGRLLSRKIAKGTADLSLGAAMTRAQAVAAIEVGIEVARLLVADGARCLITGDMGIANTTASAALIAAFTGHHPSAVTGRGAGLGDEAYENKARVIVRALQVNPTDGQALNILMSVGGLEHAAIAGFILGAAALRVPVILDGVISGAAAMVAHGLSPASIDHCVAGHLSAEPGHRLALAHLGLRPMVRLELRLGEGTGGLLAHPLVCAAARVMHEVATFDSAGVSEK